MVEWVFLNTRKINRIGYNKEVKSLYIDFVGSATDTAFIQVPESLFENFKEAKSPDKFYEQLVDGYFEILEHD